MPLPTATAYLSAADADTYFATSFNNAAWTALTAAEKDLALQEATRWLETLCYQGEKCSNTQALKWPRKIDDTSCCGAVDCTNLPPQVVEATCELALMLHKNPNAMIGVVGAAGATGAVKRQKLGELEQEFFEPSSSSANNSRYGVNAPLVLQRFPWLGDLLGECYLEGSFGSSRIIARVRS